MTIDEFNSTGWTANMFAMYEGKKYPVASCSFDEALVGLDGYVEGSDEPWWVRCENIQLVGHNAGLPVSELAERQDNLAVNEVPNLMQMWTEADKKETKWLGMAAQAWCHPTTSNIEMDSRLATVFADMLRQVAAPSPPQEPASTVSMEPTYVDYVWYGYKSDNVRSQSWNTEYGMDYETFILEFCENWADRPDLKPDSVKFHYSAEQLATMQTQLEEQDKVINARNDLLEIRRGELATLQAENEKLRGALKDVVMYMGPDVPECCGCEYEWTHALAAAKEVLAKIEGEKP